MRKTFEYFGHSADTSCKNGTAWIAKCHREWTPGDNTASTFLPFPLSSAQGWYRLESGFVYYVQKPFLLPHNSVDFIRYHLYVDDNGPREISRDHANDILFSQNLPDDAGGEEFEVCA